MTPGPWCLGVIRGWKVVGPLYDGKLFRLLPNSLPFAGFGPGLKVCTHCRGYELMNGHWLIKGP